MKLDVARLKADGGDDWRERAMEAIWDEWYRPLAAYLRTSFQLQGETEDLMQDIMLKIFRNLERFDGRHALSTWLYAIARNTCLDWLSGSRLKVMTLETEPSSRQTTEAQVMAGAVEDEVRRVLEGLGEVDRGIAWLAFYERAPYRQIAQNYGLPIHTIKNRVFSLRRQLKETLEDYHA